MRCSPSVPDARFDSYFCYFGFYFFLIKLLNINLPAIKSDFDLSDYSLSSLFGIS